MAYPKEAIDEVPAFLREDHLALVQKGRFGAPRESAAR